VSWPFLIASMRDQDADIQFVESSDMMVGALFFILIITLTSRLAAKMKRENRAVR